MKTPVKTSSDDYKEQTEVDKENPTKDTNKSEDDEENQNETPKRRTGIGCVGSCSSFVQLNNWRAMTTAAVLNSTSNSLRKTPMRACYGLNHRSNANTSSGTSSSGSGSKLAHFILTSSSSSSSGSSSSGFALESDLKGMNLLNHTHLRPTESKDDFSSPSSRHHHHHYRYSIDDGDQKSFLTPNRTSLSRPHNPFDSDLIETINCSSLTPSVFSKVLTPSRYESDDVFSWGVDNVAVLYPAEIEENPQQETSSRPVDVEMEERLQLAINSFFAQKSFAPSPWLENECPGPTVRLSPTPPCPLRTPSDGGVRSSEGEKPRNVSLGGSKSGRSLQKKDVWCQTVLSLPVDFELDPILAKYFTFRADQSEQVNEEVRLDCEDEEDGNRETDSRDGLSLSSLRRKLFANDDKELLRLEDFVSESIPCPGTPDGMMISPIIVTASSPIVSMKILDQRTDMTPRNDLASPTMSPIGTLEDLKSEDTEDVSFMSIGPSRTHTPIAPSKMNEMCVPFYFDDLGILRQDVSYSERIDKMVRKPLPSLQTGQEGTRSRRVRIALPNAQSTVAVTEEETFAAAAKVLFMDVTCDVGRTNPDLGYQTMSSSQESGQSLIIGGFPLQRTNSNALIRSDPSAPKTPPQGRKIDDDDDTFCRLTRGETVTSRNDAMESSVANTSAMMWSPIVASTPSSANRFAATN